MKKFKTENGITLIALIITIVVLLILAVVAIGAAQESNIVGYAQNAAGGYEEGKGIENNTISKYENILTQYANGVQQSQTNNDKGIGTDGQPVNMDYWKYTIISEERKEVGLYVMDGTVKSAAYVGPITAEGKIVGTMPQYIEIDGKEGTYTVTSTAGCFYEIEDLKIPPVIPNTVKDAKYMFSRTGLIEAPTIPNSITEAMRMFSFCDFTEAPIIPSNVTRAEAIFEDCKNLYGTIRIEAINLDEFGIRYCIKGVTGINKIQVPAGSVTETTIRALYGSDSNITIETF